jgi:CubicO group peptidase (beta-lactamase class C family)
MCRVFDPQLNEDETMRRSLNCLALLVGALLHLTVWAGPLPEARPEDVGMSSARLSNLAQTFQRAVEAKDLAGAAFMVARDGKLVYQGTVGMQDIARGTPMRTDSIFRIYSMTKPIVSVAAMILVEEGRLGLHEPVATYIPEFKEMRVAIEGFDATTGAQTFYTVPAKRAMTVQDLLRHTSGLTYGVFLPKTSQLGNLYREAKPFSAPTIEVFAQILAKLPLRYEPGSTWEYSHSTDILGRVVEVASGQPINVFVEQRILKPLKMTDSDWYVPAAKVDRFAQPIPGTEKNWFPELLLDFTKPATLFAGGHGMVATPGDYLRFAQMLANGGTLDGARILGPRTVAYMASDHVIGAGISKGGGYLPGPGYGFGLGFGVRTAVGQSEWMGTPGEFYWGGYAGTAFFIDPKERLVAVMMSQAPEKRQHYRNLFRATVYQAVTE